MPPEVTIYSTENCPFCQRAKEFFQARKIPFTEFRVDTDREKAKEMVRMNSKGSVPTMIINGRVVVGFVPQLMEDALRRQRLPKREELTQNLLFDPFEQ